MCSVNGLFALFLKALYSICIPSSLIFIFQVNIQFVDVPSWLWGILKSLLLTLSVLSSIVMFLPGLFKVILGGGRMYMTPKGTLDPEYPTSNSRKGDRKDKINLIDVWLKAKPVRLITYSLLLVTSLFFFFKYDSDSQPLCVLFFRRRSHTMSGTRRSLMTSMSKQQTGSWVSKEDRDIPGYNKWWASTLMDLLFHIYSCRHRAAITLCWHALFWAVFLCWAHIRPLILALISTDLLQVFCTYLQIPLHCLPCQLVCVGCVWSTLIFVYSRPWQMGFWLVLFPLVSNGDLFRLHLLVKAWSFRVWLCWSFSMSQIHAGGLLLHWCWIFLSFFAGRGNELEFKMGRSVLKAYLALFIQSLSLSDMISLLQYIKHILTTRTTQDCAGNVAYTVHNAHTHTHTQSLLKLLRCWQITFL